MIVLDASVLIAYLEGSDAHARAAADLLRGNVDEELSASTITDAWAALRDLAEQPLPMDAALRLAELRAQTSLRMPDCYVLLLAEMSNTTLASFDARLRRTAVERHVRVLP